MDFRELFFPFHLAAVGSVSCPKKLPRKPQQNVAVIKGANKHTRIPRKPRSKYLIAPNTKPRCPQIFSLRKYKITLNTRYSLDYFIWNNKLFRILFGEGTTT